MHAAIIPVACARLKAESHLITLFLKMTWIFCYIQLILRKISQTDDVIYPEVKINTESVIFNDNTIQANLKHPIKICSVK